MTVDPADMLNMRVGLIAPLSTILDAQSQIVDNNPEKYEGRRWQLLIGGREFTGIVPFRLAITRTGQLLLIKQRPGGYPSFHDQCVYALQHSMYGTDKVQVIGHINSIEELGDLLTDPTPMPLHELAAFMEANALEFPTS